VREHVSLHFYEAGDRYRVVHLAAPPRWREPEWRLHLDYPEDYVFLCEVHRRLAPVHGDRFGLEEITALLRGHPELAELNRHCVERSAR
jgi:spore coat polysaccharide biosynthesis protein SpsF